MSRKRMVRSLVKGGLLFALALGLSPDVRAGMKSSYPVSINRTEEMILASGQPGTVRADGTKDDIGCYVGAVSLTPPDLVMGGMPVVWCTVVNEMDMAVY